MGSSWAEFGANCKSRLSAIARSCFLGRTHWIEKSQETKRAGEELRKALAVCEARCRRIERENEDLRRRNSELESQGAEPRPIQLPLGDVPHGQQFGAGQVALGVNLARKFGFRRAAWAQKIFGWLGVKVKIPTHETIRLWSQRIGLARIRRAKKKTGGIWLVDHTNQIGKEKVLTVLRVRSLPPAGVALRYHDVEPLVVIPATEWKRADVAKAYQQAEARFGTPDAVVTDGAVELREPVAGLGKPGKTPRAFRDPKHFLANQLEGLLKKDSRWEAFTQSIGRSRSALQQTELAHFIPPAFKLKARFMNLGPILHWAATVLWHLDHPKSASREEVSMERMEEKLGWLREFAAHIQQWQECQKVISMTLAFLNEQGVFPGVVNAYRKLVAGIAQSPSSQQLVSSTNALLGEYEKTLQPNERLRISTEILESSFSRYKQLEQQHSKSGFTSLLLAFPMLLRPTTAKEATACFARVKVADVKAWAKEHLPNTLASKRQCMFRVANPKPKGKTHKRATALAHAT